MNFLFVIGFALFLAASSMVKGNDGMALPPQCDPETMEDAPHQLRNVCNALSTIYELSDAMRMFITEKSKPVPHFPPYLLGAGEERFDNGVKRQDLDHVFLRFGRR